MALLVFLSITLKMNIATKFQCVVSQLHVVCLYVHKL